MKKVKNFTCSTCLIVRFFILNKASAGLGEIMGSVRLVNLQGCNRWLILIMALFGSFIGPERARGQVPPSAAFDWTMPDRLIDANNDGLIDSYSGGDHAPADINPSSWQVNLDACSSTPGGSPIVLYRWSLDGISIGDSADCDGFSHAFPTEGVYPVTLTVVDAEGNEDTVEQDVIVQDWLIVSLGDSFGSGEGNPDSPIPPIAFDDLAIAYNNYSTAKNDLDTALADQASVQAAYQPVLDALAVAKSRLATLNAKKATRNDLCLPIPSSGCADAEAALVAAEAAYAAALVDLGNAWMAAGEADLAQGYDSAAWTYISNVAHAALNAAQAAVNLAQTALSIAQTAVTQAQSALGPFWQDTRCHRSAIAGSAQAALAIEKADPRTSVTFIHLACSGAKITTGLLCGYMGQEPPSDTADSLPSQVEAVKSMIGTREIDALYMSIGGNDANFGPIIEACIWQDQCNTTSAVVDDSNALAAQIDAICASVFQGLHPADPGYYIYPPCLEEFQAFSMLKTGAELQSEGIMGIPSEPFKECPGMGGITVPGLATRYDWLAERLATDLPLMPPSRVFISEYPNATQYPNPSSQDNKAYCPNPDDQNPIASIPGVSTSEMEWADTTVAAQINSAIFDAASNYGWTLIDGLYDAFADHGYCSNDGWFVRIQESMAKEGSKDGGVHPNAGGHAAYRDYILAALNASFYPTGDPTQPRVPGYNSPPVADAGGPYIVDEGSKAMLDGSGSTDPDGVEDIISYSWDLDGDGTYETGGETVQVLEDDGPADRTIGLQVCDSVGQCDITTTTVTVNNVAPDVDAGPNQTGVLRGAIVSVSGAWVDPALTADNPYYWTWDLNGDGIEDATGKVDYGNTVAEDASFDLPGFYTLTFGVTDKDGGVGHDTVDIEVINLPPDCTSATPSIGSIWPPNNKFVAMKVLGVTDPEGDEFSIIIDRIFQDEPVSDSGVGAADATGVGMDTVHLRAQREGKGNGRVYHIYFTATDIFGALCSGEVVVGVPHDHGVPTSLIDDGPIYNSALP